MPMKLANKRILVVGMARSGVAAAQLLLENGATPVLSDRKPEDAFGGELDTLRGTSCEFRLAEDPVRLLSEVDGLVISPGVPIDAASGAGCKGTGHSPWWASSSWPGRSCRARCWPSPAQTAKPPPPRCLAKSLKTPGASPMWRATLAIRCPPWR